MRKKLSARISILSNTLGDFFMKVVILAGGFGTRLSEYTGLIPKPMVEIAKKPIIWHIMSHYASFGYTDFVLRLVISPK